jgi:hypothetical protein
VAGARLDRGNRLVEGGTRMTERHAVARGDESPHEIQAAGQFGRQRDDADIRP